MKENEAEFVNELRDAGKMGRRKMKEGGGKKEKNALLDRGMRERKKRKGYSWVKYFHSICDFVIQLSEPEK